MSFVIVGLGNPGEEYKNTRHNLGRVVLESFREKNNFSEWVNNKKRMGLLSEGKIDGVKVILLEPETFMNKSGLSVKSLIANQQQAEKLIVICDDLDLPVGTFKLSFNRGTGGHKGVESIVRSIKTKGFIRVRVGISQITAGGKLKKPQGAEKVLDYLMAEWGKTDQEILKKIKPKLLQSLETLILSGRETAMNLFN